MKLDLSTLIAKPLKLEQNRVWRNYIGGKLLDEFKGNPSKIDAQLPEEWIASDTIARNPGREYLTEEGLSKIRLAEGITITLQRLIQEYPLEMLGRKHIHIFGNKLALLTKLLDAGIRLSIQVHPTKEFAKKYFCSSFGKTEAWIVLDTRIIDGEEPFILMGFKEGITQEKFKKYFEEQDVVSMINSMHKIKPQKGDIFIVPGGLIHAIGKGCFLLEIQEPTDYTIRVERTVRGQKISDLSCHQGIGFENALKCINYNGYNKEELLRRFKINKKLISNEGGNKRSEIFNAAVTDKFKVEELELNSVYFDDTRDLYYVAIVVEGKGKIISANSSEVVTISKGDALFCPARVGEHKIIVDKMLRIIKCWPPSVYYLN